MKRTYKKLKKERRELISKKMSKIVYWLALLVTIVGNLIISAALIPFLIVLKDIQIYLIIAILAIAFGLLFDLLLRDIEHLDFRHHIIAVIFIPGMAILNLFIITNLSNRLIEILEVVNIKHDPIRISIIYAIIFMIPYIISRIRIK